MGVASKTILLFTIAASYIFSSNALADSTVNVLLQEWRMMSDKARVPSGKIKFSVQNRGRETHELVLIKTDAAYDSIPLKPTGGIDEEKVGVLIDEIENITSKHSKAMTVNLVPGNYVLLCNMVEMEPEGKEEHYAMGMRIPLVVE